MAVTVKELVTKWTFKVDDKAIKNAEQGVANLKSAVKTLAVVGAAAAGTVFALAKSVADAGDFAAKSAKQIGVNAESLQEFAYAAQIGGATTKDVVTGFRLLARVVNESRGGMQSYTDALVAMGLTQEEINDTSLTSDDLLLKIADSFQKMKDPIQKTALAAEVFGRAGTKLIPMLNEGSAGISLLREEAKKLGIVLDANTLLASEEFQDSLLRAKSAVMGIRNIVGAQLIPILTKLFDRFKEWVLINRPLVSKNIKEFISGLIGLLKSLWGITKIVVTVWRGFAQLFGGTNNVIKLLLKLITVLIAGKFLIGLGALSSAFWSLAMAIGGFGNAALVANLKFLALGATIALIFLAIEDFYHFMMGNESVLGDLLGAKKSETVRTGIKKTGKAITSSEEIKQGVLGTPGAPRQVDFSAMWEGIKKGASFLGEKLNSGMQDNRLINVDGPGESSLLPQANNQTSINQPVNNVFNITTPQNLNPEQAGKYIQNGVKDSLNSALEISNANRPTVSY